jgi:hypothetical protein
MNQSFKLFGFEFTVTSFVAILVWVVSVTLQKFLLGSIDEVATAFTIITIQVLNLIARFKGGEFDWKSSTFWMGVFGTLIMGVDVFATGASDILSGSVVIIIGSLTTLGQLFGIKNFLQKK